MTPLSKPVNNPPANNPSRRRRVLIADDSVGMRAYLSTILSAAGFACSEAVDGAEAFEMILHNDFDLVITDLDMPNVDGLQLLAAIQVLAPGRARPPVLVCSAQIDQRRRERRAELNLAAALVEKPATARDILSAVEAILARDAAAR